MTAPARPVLTERQYEVLQLVAAGRTYRQAARELGIGPAAVANRMEHAMRQLQASTPPHAVLLACQAGLLDGRPQRHGDHAGYEAHRKRGEDPKLCEACVAGEREHRSRYKGRQRA
ncbi:response regulator transcription factor [Streptomyces vinaceus]|uniref:response regulator transcription factor n=1 Tax=Streptomyces vinaceus TaxID=1960 RepID=UPI0036912909